MIKAINFKKGIKIFFIFCFILLIISLPIHGKEIVSQDNLLTVEDYLIKNMNSYIYITDREYSFDVANKSYNKQENKNVRLLAQLVYAEARGVSDDKKASAKAHQAAIIWTVLNRVDAGYGTIEEVICAPNQFAYNSKIPVLPEFSDLAIDVLVRWEKEKNGEKEVGRVLPKQYLWFGGNGKVNRFRDKYKGNFTIWNWEMKDPYAKS